MICETVARSASPEPPPPTATAAAAEIWGTWEDLLLACAVSRLGSKTWDSVASEVRSRSPAAAAALLTPDACRRRYRHLQSQFSSPDVAVAASGGGEVPWLEELRKLRVAELRREVQRYDVSIGTLQLKVKRLKEEERERTLGAAAAANGEKGPDLTAVEERKDLRSPGSTPADRISAGDSGRSCKESNSTDPKGLGGDGQQPPREATDDPCPRGQPSVTAAAAEEKSVGESSYNGSSDTIARGAAAGRSEPSRGRAPPQDVGESGESFAESKGGEAAESRNSDVQSSAGLSHGRRGRRRKAVLGRPGGGGGEEKEKDPDANSARAPEESQPLLVLLEIIRSHKCGFAFESRLESQDGAAYNGLVKQHVDLDTVRGRIVGGGGYTRLELFRDLLLICNNAIVYYPKGSPEFSAAVKLRQLVNNEISATSKDFSAPPLPSQPPPTPQTQLEGSKEDTNKEATPPAGEGEPPGAPNPPPTAPKLKPELDLVRSSKPGPLPPPLIACKKRSSITTKPSVTKKVDRLTNEEKAADRVLQEDEKEVPKVKEKRTVVSGTRGPRTNKTRGIKGGKVLGGEMANRKLDPAEEETDAPEPVPANKAEKEKKGSSGGGVTVAKKRSAAIFLDRLNRGAPPKTKGGGASSSKGELMETLKAAGTGSGLGAGQKKGERRKGGGRKEQTTRQSSAAAKEAAAAGELGATPVKRSVGRPPKRAAPPLPLSPPVKRAREEKAAAAPPQPSRKRARK